MVSVTRHIARMEAGAEFVHMAVVDQGEVRLVPRSAKAMEALGAWVVAEARRRMQNKFDDYFRQSGEFLRGTLATDEEVKAKLKQHASDLDRMMKQNEVNRDKLRRHFRKDGPGEERPQA
jgi:hypothetical protein